MPALELRFRQGAPVHPKTHHTLQGGVTSVLCTLFRRTDGRRGTSSSLAARGLHSPRARIRNEDAMRKENSANQARRQLPWLGKGRARTLTAHVALHGENRDVFLQGSEMR